MSINIDGGLVSVIIPCYNHGDFIIETLESIENSSYSNIEVIIVDDGSNDNLTRAILKEIENNSLIKNSRVKVFYQKNKGPAAARNLAILQSNGEYILPLDADDKIHSEYIQKAIYKLNSDNSIGFVYPGVIHFGMNNHSYLPKKFNFLRLLFRNYIVVSGIFRKRAWESINGYDETITGFEDWDFWIKIGSKGYNGYALNEKMLYYRQTADSKGKSDNKKYYSNLEEIRLKNRSIYMNQYKNNRPKYLIWCLFERSLFILKKFK